MKSVLAMTDRLKADLPHMIEEHNQIVTTLEHLTKMTEKERKQARHYTVKVEEQVLYPA